jgi:hypothetical protein
MARLGFSSDAGDALALCFSEILRGPGAGRVCTEFQRMDAYLLRELCRNCPG